MVELTPGRDRPTQVLPDNVSGLSAGNSSRRTVLSSLSAAQAVKLLAKQVPEFDGSWDSNVEFWISTVEQVARIHSVADDVVLLAATDKLTKSARALVG